MCFEQLHESARRGELLLVDGGMCHWHLRRDGQLTIREIIATRPGAGSEMLAVLMDVTGASSLYARCPVDLPSNDWYRRRGFALEDSIPTRNGRGAVNAWRLVLC